MARGVAYFKKNKNYKILKNILANRYGGDLAKRVFEFAGQEMDRLLWEYPEVPKGVRTHVYDYIFPRAAAYRGMKQEIGEDALPVMEEFILQQGSKAGASINRFLALPGMGKIGLKIIKYMAKNMFGPKNGFQQTIYKTDKNQLRFDITDCPYCKYCKICGCSDLIHTFCDSDSYCYGNLSKIEFHRTTTLEKDDKCDFCFSLKEKEKNANG